MQAGVTTRVFLESAEKTSQASSLKKFQKIPLFCFYWGRNASMNILMWIFLYVMKQGLIIFQDYYI
jgi:hypothetical protein